MMSIPSYSDPPFAVAPDIVLDLPVPPSVNKTRRYDVAATRMVMAWKARAEPLVLAAKCRSVNPLKLARIKRFEIEIVVSEKHTEMDLDNGVKTLIDYLKTIEVIKDDAKRNMRVLTVRWGIAPEGCRVIVKPLPATVNDVLRINAERLEAAQ